MYPKRMWPDELRVLAFDDVGSSYTALGSPLSVNPRIIKFINDTDGLMYFSWDGVTDHGCMPHGSFNLLDCVANKVRDDGFFPPIGTQFYVKYSGVVPTTGNVVLEIYYATGGDRE